MDFVKFTEDKLSVEDITNLVLSEKCGAVSVFVGTTRDNFEGKEVVKLEYEAYENMGLKAMKKICAEIRDTWKDVENIAIYHRLGTVPVKEASIVIAISSPHRAEAIKATEWCIDNVKKSVPIWKKEVYSDSATSWKENEELSFHPPRLKKRKLEIEQEVEVTAIPSHLIQIKASSEEIEERIERFMERKREEINAANVRDFCHRDSNSPGENLCARIDSVLVKRVDSKGHLQVNRVYNGFSRDQSKQEYLSKFIPKDGIEERMQNVETQLCLHRPVAEDIYQRLKAAEDRVLYLEAVSPEYIQFWDKASLNPKGMKKKRIFSLDEINNLITEVQNRRNQMI